MLRRLSPLLLVLDLRRPPASADKFPPRDVPAVTPPGVVTAPHVRRRLLAPVAGAPLEVGTARTASTTTSTRPKTSLHVLAKGPLLRTVGTAPLLAGNLPLKGKSCVRRMMIAYL